MSIDVRIISIGTLARHPLWGEPVAVRTGHATTTLIRSGKVTILVDPGLPADALRARLAERANIRPEQVTHVFLTSFQQDTTRGLELFEHAPWLIHSDEREGQGVPLIGKLKLANDEGETAVRNELARQVAILHRCEVAPESLGNGIDIFPLPGVTPGMCGLIVDTGETTTLICGDAIATSEHVTARKVLPVVHDLTAAKASFAEAVGIADVLIPGRDNLLLNDIDLAPDEEELESPARRGTNRDTNRGSERDE